MAIDLTGITNVNEYYTNHYINTILEEDIKNVISTFKQKAEESGQKTPWSAVRAFSKDYYLLNNRLTRNTNMEADLQNDFLKNLFCALGYDIPLLPIIATVKDNLSIPLFAEVQKQNGAPQLWLLSVQNLDGEENNIISGNISQDSFLAAKIIDTSLSKVTIEELITKYIYSSNEPPRWLIIAGISQIALIDRNKWGEKRILIFDMQEIYARREESTLEIMSMLLHRDNLCPVEGTSFLDTLNENSHKHGTAVSESLKYALRECIELLGNEAVYDMRERQKVAVYNKSLAEKLTIECLRYMYRILFLLYIEARPELKYAPMKSDVYLKGYSIESLRDLEMIRLETDDAKNGTYINQTLNQLFKLIYEGYPDDTKKVGNDYQTSFEVTEEITHNAFTISPLKAHIFDPERTPLLNRVQFRNEVLQKIIKLMSLSRPKSTREKPGRISYSQLDINQLGAVYEALLSYSGFFAEVELYEVKRESDQVNELDVGYFVTETQLADYNESERVRDGNGRPKKYEKGTFIYRLAGREREKSASYYTPKVLTECLVKYALKELLKDKTADEILELTICEPAMGSAAFLNEAINQLTDAYLERKQKETNITIDHDKYIEERQKVKAYIADRNVYGVDLNPVAVELAEVSIWLNSIYKNAFVPWFGTQLKCGNSLIGARRQYYKPAQVANGTAKEYLWYNAAPERVLPGTKRPHDGIYNFLMPDMAMSDYTDKVIKELAKDEIQKFKNWRNDFIKPYRNNEIDTLIRLSSCIDSLWDKHITVRKQIEDFTTDKMSIFGHSENSTLSPLTTRQKDKFLQQELFSEGVKNAGPYARLKFAMDYWCALWFWPIGKADLLPSKPEFLLELQFILEGNIISVDGENQLNLFGEKMPEQLLMELYSDIGEVNLGMLCEKSERLRTVRQIAERYRFHHWELEFADIFASKGGFDLILGNPPWIKLEWKEQGILGDIEPKVIVKNYSATETGKVRNVILSNVERKLLYYSEYEAANNTQNFLNAIQNYPFLMGMQTNLYKCFLPQSWMIGNNKSISGFVHPDSVYEDAKGGIFREQIYKRLRCHFQFVNELILFQIHHEVTYSLNIFSNTSSGNFLHMSNLYLPKTIDESFDVIGTQKEVGGLKNDENIWNTKGHPDRILQITSKELELFAKLFDDETTACMQAKLPALHVKQLIQVLKVFSSEKHSKLYNYSDKFDSSVMFDESNAQKNGTIKRETRFPDSTNDLILSGPHIHIANPLFKTPRCVSKLNSDYDNILLSEISDNYIPRTNYTPSCNMIEFKKRIPDSQFGGNISEYYKICVRKMLSNSTERTLYSSIISPKTTHINGIYSMSYKDKKLMVYISALFASIPYDFFIRSVGKSNFQENLCGKLPVPNISFDGLLIIRSLLLNCVTRYYAPLWQECFKQEYTKNKWAKSDLRLRPERFSLLTSQWSWDIPLRTDYERRQALVEIDVLTAMALGMTLDQLKIIYRIQFPVLQSYEASTYYDQNGRIVFSNNRGLTNVGYTRSEWEQIKETKNGIFIRTIIDDTQPGGPIERIITYTAPFDSCDREKDYETVWVEFEKRFRGVL
jgi:hypothetical protein